MSEKNEWKPIESAPKDGSEFLACYTRQGNVTQIVKWNTLHGYFASKGEWLPGFTANATHWMPLPAAPGSAPSAPASPWRDIMTAEDSDDLIWLYDCSNNSIDGPRTLCASDVDWYTHWAPCEAPETSRAAPGSTSSTPGDAQDIGRELTAAVREADSLFVKIGGSSRHWAIDCFLPSLRKRGLDIAALAAQVPHKGDAA